MTSSESPAAYDILREQMVNTQLRARGISDERVLGAMARVPRHEFAPEKWRVQAYEDHPLPIGEGQTISQPYIVALMLEALKLSPRDKVLEVGTGSGYVTALLGELASEIISVERHATLADSARALLARLGHSNVKIVIGDGSRGFADSAPYNAIIVSAAAVRMPRDLVEQLADGGRMIIPVGWDESQQLQLVRMENGQPKVQSGELCRFVPLISEDGK
jgi:protein-L-isoaspartate(D-aspartate) O-methyltransferase